MIQGRRDLHTTAESRADAPVLDQDHLAQMTLGDASLQREVLTLFCAQSERLLAQMTGSAGDVLARDAHTLAGAARGIGAWQVADAAAAVELSAREGAGTQDAAIAALSVAIAAAQAVIAAMRAA